MANRKNWYKLDNAAKIVPSTAKGANTRVFRITCQLKEKVEEEILQRALDEIIEDYPIFNCVLHRGIFWYYLEDSDLREIVKKRVHRPARLCTFRDIRISFTASIILTTGSTLRCSMFLQMALVHSCFSKTL